MSKKLNVDFSKINFLGNSSKAPKIEKNVTEECELYLTIKKFYECYNKLDKDQEKELAKFCFEQKETFDVLKAINLKLDELNSKLTGLQSPCVINGLDDFISKVDFGSAHVKDTKSKKIVWLKKEGTLLDHLPCLRANYTNKEILHGLLNIHLLKNKAIDGTKINITEDMSQYLAEAIASDNKITDKITKAKANSLIDYYILDSKEHTDEIKEILQNNEYHDSLKEEMKIIEQTIEFLKKNK